MKKIYVLFIAIFCVVFGVIIGGGVVYIYNKIKSREMVHAQTTLIQARLNMIELNKEYNWYYNRYAGLALRDIDENAESNLRLLQWIFPSLIKLNKSLELDCKSYNNGVPVMIRDKNGKIDCPETLPEEIRLLE